MKSVLLVFVGGGLGSALRFAIGKYLNTSANTIPWGTFAANILGSLIIGLVLGIALKNSTFTQNQVLFLTTGFCGGFTTFSTFAYENQVFLKYGDLTSFAIYSIASFVLAILAVVLGLYLAKLV